MPGAERVARADAARQQVERFGKMLLELVEPLRPLVLENRSEARRVLREADGDRPRLVRQSSSATKAPQAPSDQRNQQAGADG